MHLHLLWLNKNIIVLIYFSGHSDFTFCFNCHWSVHVTNYKLTCYSTTNQDFQINDYLYAGRLATGSSWQITIHLVYYYVIYKNKRSIVKVVKSKFCKTQYGKGSDMNGKQHSQFLFQSIQYRSMYFFKNVKWNMQTFFKPSWPTYDPIKLM